MFGHILTSQCKDSYNVTEMDICVLLPNQEQLLSLRFEVALIAVRKQP